METLEEIKSRVCGAFAPRDRVDCVQWAERNRILTPEESSEPGPWNWDRTPYWRFVANLVIDPSIEEIICIKGAQLGWSELVRLILGFWIDQDPGPVLILTADQSSADAYRDERLEPLMKTPAIAQHLSAKSWDTQKYRVRFDTSWLFLTWSGSKSGTKTRPIQRLICEEPDDFLRANGGPDPLSKAMKRLTTYSDKGRAKALIGGTPTTRTGTVWKRWELSPVRYHYHVPCPKCGTFQRLQWKQVKWPSFADLTDGQAAQKIKAEHLAHYECVSLNCQHHIQNHEKPRMLRRGVWAAECQTVTVDGQVIGTVKKSKRVAVSISSMYSPWLSYSDLACEWLESQNDPEALADFINQRLGETWEQTGAKIETTIIEAKRTGSPASMIVPKWAQALIATADTQGRDELTGYFYYVIRCWGYNYQSQLVDHGIANSKEELVQRCLNRTIPGEDGRAYAPQMLVIDSGGPRWNEIYQLAQGDNRIHPAKGYVARTWMVDERLQKRHNVVLWLIDTEQSKDLLYRLINDGDRTHWQVNNGATDDYVKQMVSEAKIYSREHGREIWSEVIKNYNHYWDCEAMQAATAWRIGCGQQDPAESPPPPTLQSGQQQQQQWLPPYSGSWLAR